MKTVVIFIYLTVIWNVIGDTVHDTIDEAKQVAAVSNNVTEQSWIEK